MNGNSYVLDTNAVLYILNGDQALAELLFGAVLYVSVISEMELLSYMELGAAAQEKIQSFLSEFKIIGLNKEVRNQAIAIRKITRLKLPDSIIAATAQTLGLPLVSADKHFKKVSDLSLVLLERT